MRHAAWLALALTGCSSGAPPATDAGGCAQHSECGGGACVLGSCRYCPQCAAGSTCVQGSCAPTSCDSVPCP